ncbi:Copper-containing nitrite reductase OS=Streptomyces fumanus OX=67302 GN=GCM10018772_70100 PE=4 SV=1 [Streptomyces fumanus]
MAEPLFLLDMVLALILPLAGVQLGRHAGRLRSGRPVRRWPLYAVLAIAVVRAAVAVLLLLTSGWAVAGQRVLLGLPVLVLPLGWALVAARRGGPAATAWHTAAMGALASSFLLFVPPGPQDLTVAALGCLAVLGGAAAVSRFSAAHRGPAAGRLARLPWQGLIASAGVAVVLTGLATTAPSDHSGPHASSADWGGGSQVAQAAPHHGGHHSTAPASAARSVSTLTGPRDTTPNVRFHLTAARGKVRLSSGRTVDALLFNGRAPGPRLTVHQGDLVEVTLSNKDVREGVTLHWHGVDVPNAEDGVPGVTQDAVPPGGEHVYRFVPDRAGTFWYHTHRDADSTVRRGLFGSLIVEEPRGGQPAASGHVRTLFTHVWPGSGVSFGTHDTPMREAVRPGDPVTLKVVNSSEEPQRLLVGGVSYRVTALDGNTVDHPGRLPSGTDLLLPAGGRYDLAFTMPTGTVTVRAAEGEAALALSPDGHGAPARLGEGTLFDRLTYGRPAPGATTVPDRYDRDFDVVLDSGFGFADGQFTYGNTMNGRMAPDVPTLMVTEGDRVRVRITNRSVTDHPMHLHGHRVQVLSRNGTPATGSPWFTDTLNVAPGESYEVFFTADNPGIWMDHCHNFSHTAQGMIMHLAYSGVVSPYHGTSH